MAKLILHKSGGVSINMTQLTAAVGDVAEGDIFYGTESMIPQRGILTDNGVVLKKLEPNEIYDVPPGIYLVGSEVYQEIEIEDGKAIAPTAAGGFVGILRKYMNGDITIAGIENLVPENIRSGAFIGTVPGVWQGFVNNDPLSPYWYGIFAPGQTGTLILNRPPASSYTGERYIAWQEGNARPDGQYIFMSTRAGFQNQKEYPAFRFDVPIEMQGIKSITIRYRLPAHSANAYTWMVISENADGRVADSNWNINPLLGRYEKFTLPPSDDGGQVWIEKTFSLSQAHLYHYIYVGIGVPQSNNQGRFIGVKYIKLNKQEG